MTFVLLSTGTCILIITLKVMVAEGKPRLFGCVFSAPCYEEKCFFLQYLQNTIENLFLIKKTKVKVDYILQGMLCLYLVEKKTF